MTGNLLIWGIVMHNCNIKSRLRRILLYWVLIIFIFSLSACSEPRTPPTTAKVESFLEQKYDEILTVVNFMCNLNYDDIIILHANGEMLVDLESKKIIDKNVKNAILQLKQYNDSIDFVKQGNIIYITIWVHSQEISSGIAYSINGIDVPNAEFQTEIRPLSKDNWYYFICDYHIYRSGRQGDGLREP